MSDEDTEVIWEIDCSRCDRHLEAPPAQLVAAASLWHLQMEDRKITAVVCDNCQDPDERRRADESARELDAYVASELERVGVKHADYPAQAVESKGHVW